MGGHYENRDALGFLPQVVDISDKFAYLRALSAYISLKGDSL
jgi:hypothetical protein